MRRSDLKSHYLTEEHQRAILEAVRYLSTHQLHTERTSQSSSELNEIMKHLSDNIPILTDDIKKNNEKLSCLQDHVRTSRRDLALLESDVREQNVNSEELKNDLQILQQTLDSSQRKITDTILTSHDGMPIWKITGVFEKLSEICLTTRSFFDT